MKNLHDYISKGRQLVQSINWSRSVARILATIFGIGIAVTLSWLLYIKPMLAIPNLDEWYEYILVGVRLTVWYAVIILSARFIATGIVAFIEWMYKNLKP